MTNRRKFIKQSALTSAAIAFGTEAFSFQKKRKLTSPNDKIRVGFIGLGNRGSQLLSWFMENDDVEVVKPVGDLGHRSTSVGDYMRVDGTLYRVAGMGFEPAESITTRKSI